MFPQTEHNLRMAFETGVQNDCFAEVGRVTAGEHTFHFPSDIDVLERGNQLRAYELKVFRGEDAKGKLWKAMGQAKANLFARVDGEMRGVIDRSYIAVPLSSEEIDGKLRNVAEIIEHYTPLGLVRYGFPDSKFHKNGDFSGGVIETVVEAERNPWLDEKFNNMLKEKADFGDSDLKKNVDIEIG